jgi:citrate synthase
MIAVNVDSAINMSGRQPWISAADAAALLGVSRTTLYAYVSRGRVRSQAIPGSPRERQYSSEDLERLRKGSEERRHPDKAAARALQWGLPVLESAITLIDGSGLYYRGHDALALASTRSVAEVASLIWTGDAAAPIPQQPRRGRRPRPSADLPYTARVQSLLAAASAIDPAALDLRPAAVAACGWRILDRLTDAATLRRDRGAGPTIDRTLAGAWRMPPWGASLIRAVLILCADHELNVSSFTARCVASTGASPYEVVIAGFSALNGPKHGGAGARVVAMLQSLRAERSLRPAIAARLRRGERIEGFGHPLYPAGDPRATMLLGLLRERAPRSAELRFILAVAQAAAALTGEKPNIDFALAAAARVLELPAEAPLMLFGIGRTIGWIGHAIEQYATGQLIRPRARYAGVAPSSPGAGGTQSVDD